MIISFAIVISGVLFQDRGQVSGQTFLNLDRANAASAPLPYPGCQQADIDSCVKADLNLYILMTSTSIQLPDGSKLQLSHREDNHVCYKSDKAEAVFTWQGSHVAGNVHVGAESWSLEGCGEKCYLWIKQSSNWQDEVSSSYTEITFVKPRPPANYSMLRNQGERDTTTVVDISVMIWYTSQFRNTFQSEEDMEVFVDLVFAETNQGYINSEIPVRLVRYQIKQHPTMNDIGNAYQMLEDFESSMPLADLHNCADAAVLLVEQFGSSHTCGIGNVGATLDCRTLSITKKSCATGYYSFGHEIGLNFGCLHNPEVGHEGITGHFGHSDDGHAHLIMPDDSGYRTILAFGAEGHYKRVNYYSNPKVLLPQTKTPTGVSSVSNNARIITANRFAMAECGNEQLNSNCNGGTSTTSSSDTTKESSTKSSVSKIELRGGSVPTEGNVFLNGHPVCDDMWDQKDARVACRMLGYSSGVPTNSSQFGQVPSEFILDDVMCEGTESSLLDCAYSSTDNCDGNEGAGVICRGSSTKSKIELRGGSSNSEGNVFVNGQPVCDDMWDKNDADVACRMLGYSSGFPTTKSKFGSVPSEFILDDVMCDGTENTLFDCNYNEKENCERNEAAGVICSGSEPKRTTPTYSSSKIELRGGSRRTEGNVFVNGKPVCDDMWDKKDATVACRMLGYSSGEPSVRSKFGKVPTDFIADDVMCEGTEKSLFDCKHRPHANCGETEGAGVICKGKSDSSPPQRYELAPPRSTQLLTCGEENNQHQRNHHRNNYRHGQCVFPFKLFGVEYSECLPYGGKYWCALNYNFNIHSGNWGYCDQAVCPPTGVDTDKRTTPALTLVKIELRGGSHHTEGNVFVNGKPVCDDMWDEKDATVACRMLGYDSGVATTKSKFGQVPSEYILDDVMCDGTETSLLDCGYSATDNCAAGEGAGVICKGRAMTPPPSPIQTKDHDDKHDHDLSKIELRGGSSPSEGNVFVNGKPVCDDMWDKNDATVACRMLGFSHGEPSIRSKFGKVPTDFVLDDVMCDGTEKSLFDCGHRSHANCGGAEGAGVICKGKTHKSSGQGSQSGNIELHGGNSASEGNVFVNGKPICDDIWNLNDAIVACRMLGFPFGGIATTDSAFGNVTPNYIMTDVKCTGKEKNLFDCRYTLDNDCTGAEAAGVKCKES